MAKNNGNNSDERMSHATAHDAGFRETETDNAPGASFDHDGAMELADFERRRKLREMWDERILPNLPNSKGFHRCWVSTTHPIDTVQRRRRFGYRFVPMDDVRNEGWSADTEAVKDGQFAGAVMWRE